MGFLSLGLNQDIVNTAKRLGYDQPTPVQLAAIPAIINQQDVMARAQTGTGKTAAFALPLVHNLCAQPLGVAAGSKPELRTLVLTPTRELAQQVFNSFKKYAKGSSLKTAIAYGGVSIKPQIAGGDPGQID